MTSAVWTHSTEFTELVINGLNRPLLNQTYIFGKFKGEISSENTYNLLLVSTGPVSLSTKI